MKIDQERIKSQTASYLDAIAHIVYSVLEKKTPLDRELKHYFRGHPECGSRDRDAITESCFSLFRWYGWIKQVLPKSSPQQSTQLVKCAHALSAALWLDHHDNMLFFDSLLDMAQLEKDHITSAPNDLEERKKKLGHFFKLRKLRIEQLVPDWFDAGLLDNKIILLQRRPPVWIRTQYQHHDRVCKQLDQQGIEYDKYLEHTNVIKIKTTKFKALSLPCYEEGCFEIQDLASQCIGQACGAQSNETWWDVCAGAGGKTLLLADVMHNQGRIVATDIRQDVLKKLQKRVERAQYDCVDVMDLADVTAGDDVFDGVLVDAPCSCTGVWRRNPDLRWTTSEDACACHAETQMNICTMAAQKVKPGGVLVYATCSMVQQENEDVVHAFLRENPDFVLDSMRRIEFDLGDNDAMFVARLKRAF